MSKLYTLKAKNGTYTTSAGEEKPNYVKCGVVLKGEYGPYIMFDKTFNPAGIETDPGRNGIFISMFKDDDQNNGTPTPARSPQQQQQQRVTPTGDPEDDIGF
jgi:hypothetical protein